MLSEIEWWRQSNKFINEFSWIYRPSFSQNEMLKDRKNLCARKKVERKEEERDRWRRWKRTWHAYEQRLSPNKIRLCIVVLPTSRRGNDEHIVNKSSLQLVLTRLYAIFSASFNWLSLPSAHPWLLTPVTLRVFVTIDIILGISIHWILCIAGYISYCIYNSYLCI